MLLWVLRVFFFLWQQLLHQPGLKIESKRNKNNNVTCINGHARAKIITERYGGNVPLKRVGFARRSPFFPVVVGFVMVMVQGRGEFVGALLF